MRTAAPLFVLLLSACSVTAGTGNPLDGLADSADPPAASDAPAADPPADDPPSDSEDPPVAPPPKPTGPKAPLAGLVDMQDISWHNTAGGEPTFTMANVTPAFDGVFGGIVINATWDQLQPSAGGALDFSAIDAALAQISVYNAAHPTTPLGAKLRVYGGANAPAWAKELGGAHVDIQRNPAGCQSGSCPLTIGRMWTAEYITAWRSFQTALAAQYDSEPIIRHVTVTSCAQQTDEPFVPTSDATSKANLVAAGYTDALQQACLTGAVDDYAAWKLTNVDFTINAFVQTGAPADVTTFPESVMDGCRTKLGARCVLGNHALSAPLRASEQPIYDALSARGGSISFQTESPQAMGCLWTQTIAQGVALGAGSVEIWPKKQLGGFTSLQESDVAQLASELVTPISVDPNPVPLPKPCAGFH
jgi:hypothetical protein